MLQNQNNRKLSLEFSFNRPQGAQASASSSNSSAQTQNDSLASERLRKAIERNRAKQMMRGQSNPTQPSSAPKMSSPPPVPPGRRAEMSSGARPQAARAASPSMQSDSVLNGSSLAERLKAKREEAQASMRKWDGSEKKAAASTSAASAASSPSMENQTHDLFATRKSVAKPESSELMGELKKKNQVPTTLAYAPVAAPTVRAKRKVKTKKDATTKDIKTRFNNLVVKGGWLFCVFLMGRLVFSDGGIMDYYSQKNLLDGKVRELEANKKENELLAKEIELIKDDSNYQKKIVRDNLGMIAKDEFLILFPKETSGQAI